MANKATSKAVSDAVAKIATQIVQDAGVAETPDDLRAARMAKRNSSGGLWKVGFTLEKREGYPDPLCITVVDEIKWVKRGKEVMLPWYFVEHMLGNVQRKYRNIKDKQTGMYEVVWDDVPAESFRYREIDAGLDDNGVPFRIEGPNAAPVPEVL